MVENWNAVVGVSAPVLGCLIGLNIWFLGRMAKKMDKMEVTINEKIPVHQIELKNMSSKIGELEKQIHHLSNRFEDFGQLRERIAVLESGKCACAKKVKQRAYASQ